MAATQPLTFWALTTPSQELERRGQKCVEGAVWGDSGSRGEDTVTHQWPCCKWVRVGRAGGL